MWSSSAFLFAAATLVAACGSSEAGGGSSGSSGSGGAGGAGGSAGASAGGGGGGAGSSGAGGAGASGAGGAGGASSAGGSAGASNVLFRDDFDAPDPAWEFDPTDPVASYTLDGGVLTVTGGSLQAFGWLPLDPAWGDDLEVEMGFVITSGLTGGPIVRGTTSPVNALNCNLREDLDQLRAAHHQNRSYLTLASAPKPVELGVDYAVTARVTGSTLLCLEPGGTSVSLPNVVPASGRVGFYVYQGTLSIDWFEVRKPL